MTTSQNIEILRTYQAFLVDTGTPLTFDRYLELRAFWRDAGGEFFGPNIEHGSMPESKLLPLLMKLKPLTGDVR